MKKFILFIAIFSLMAVYTGVWLYKAYVAKNQAIFLIQDWQEQGIIKTVKYDNLFVRGFPYSLEIVFENPQLGLSTPDGCPLAVIEHQGFFFVGTSLWYPKYWLESIGKTIVMPVANSSDNHYILRTDSLTCLVDLQDQIPFTHLFLSKPSFRAWKNIKFDSKGLYLTSHGANLESQFIFEPTSLILNRTLRIKEKEEIAFQWRTSTAHIRTIPNDNEEDKKDTFENFLLKIISEATYSQSAVTGTIYLFNDDESNTLKTYLGPYYTYLPNCDIQIDHCESTSILGQSKDQLRISLRPQEESYLIHVQNDGFFAIPALYFQSLHNYLNQIMEFPENFVATTDTGKIVREAILKNPAVFRSLIPKIYKDKKINHLIDMKCLLTPKAESLNIDFLLKHFGFSLGQYRLQTEGTSHISLPYPLSSFGSASGNFILTLTHYKPLLVHTGNYINKCLTVFNVYSQNTEIPKISSATLKHFSQFCQSISDNPEKEEKDLKITFNFVPDQTTIGTLPLIQVALKWQELLLQIQQDWLNSLKEKT